MKKENLELMGDEEQIRKIIQNVLDEHIDLIPQYKGGDRKLLSFFVGQTMKRTEGKANPALVNKWIREVIERM